MLQKNEQVLGVRYVETRSGDKLAVTRWQNDKRVITYEDLPFSVYGFVRDTDVKQLDVSATFGAKIENTRLFTILNEGVSKLSVIRPIDLRDAWLKYNTDIKFYEADVPAGKRYYIDEDLQLLAVYKPAYVDIETDPRQATSDDIKNASKRVLSVAVVDEDGSKHFICEDDEALLFTKLDKLIQNYTVAVSWSDYDFTYLKKRAQVKNYQCPFVRSTEAIDMMYYFAQLVVKKTASQYFKLVKAVAYMRELGADVDEMPDMGVKEDYNKVWQYYTNDRDALQRYNVADSIAMQQIDKALHLTHSMYELMRKFNLWPNEFRHHSKIEDFAKLRLARKRQRVLPNKPAKKIKLKGAKKAKGGFVYPPVAGYHEYIIVLDFAGLYPSIMRSLNIGLDSLIRDCANGEACDEHYKAANGMHYSKTMLALNSEYLDDIAVFFDEYDAELKAAQPDTLAYTIATIKRLKTKLTKNANYGVTGYETSRLFDKDVLESTALTGQDLIKFASKIMLERFGIPTIYGDTDSIFLKLPGPLNEEKLRKSIIALNTAIQEFSKQKFGAAIDTEIELDYYADKAYFTKAKKRYLMHVVAQDWPPKPCDYIKIAGFETQRRDSTQLLKDVQKLVFEPLLNGVPALQLEAQYKTHFKQLQSDLFAGKLDDKIIYTKAIHAELSEYKSSLPHTRAAKILQDLGQYNTGSDIEYVVISCDKVKERKFDKKTNKTKNVYKELIATYPNVANRPAIKQSGYEYVWQNQVVAILERLGMYVNDAEISLPPQQKTLFQFRRMRVKRAIATPVKAQLLLQLRGYS